MTLTLIFIFLLVLENIFLPALVGVETFLIIPIFLASVIVFRENKKSDLISVLVFLLIGEYFSGRAIGDFTIPFILTAGIYIWINIFLSIGSGLRESSSLLSILGGVIVLLLFVYI